MRSTCWIALVALLALASAGCGAPEAPPPPAEPNAAAPPQDSSFKHEAAGIEFRVPGGWRSHTDRDRMTFSAPDGTLTIVLFTAADENMAAIADEVDRQIGAIVAKPKADGGFAQSEVNGIPVMTQKGTGEVDGKPVEWTVRLIEAKQHVLMLAFGVPGAFDKYYPDLDRFQHSVKPL